MIGDTITYNDEHNKFAGIISSNFERIICEHIGLDGNFCSIIRTKPNIDSLAYSNEKLITYNRRMVLIEKKLNLK